MSTKQFAEPTSPWALNQTELDHLRRRVIEAEAQGDHQDARILRQQLTLAESEAKLAMQRKASAANRGHSGGKTPAQYAVPQRYWEVVVNQDDLARLKAEAAELRRVLEAKSASWVERQRAQTRLAEVERLLAEARTDPKRSPGAHAQAQHAAAATRPTPRLVRGDNGSYLVVGGRLDDLVDKS
jgi:hypothetical protein